MDVVLDAKGLAKAYGGRRAVDGVDLSIAAGERVALLGPNGAGKTTTLLILLGAVTPDAGTVELLGHRLPQGRSAAMGGVGFAAGYLPLPERMRVREVLSVFARLYGIADPAPAIAAGLGRFGIEHLAGEMASELSSGQRTLVGIVKATLHHPRLLVLDEPTASLDPDVAHRVREALECISEEDGCALLVTSHNMTDVEQVCERVVFLSRGRVIADAAPDQVAAQFGRADLEQVFLH
ncbi:MAG: ABC transporter ATP-binding protein, partial [Actinomycetota bacterium]|nr:ABC transporter ATP-binding protein [Actinomycetota bacterium]